MRRLWTLAAFAGFLACSDTPTPIEPDPDPDPDPELPGDTLPAGNGDFTVDLVPVATGLVAPVLVTALANDPRLFIVQQDGRIRVFDDGELRATPFLDLRGSVLFDGEAGLLGMAFHPDYAQNGYFYVNYMDLDWRTHIVRYRVSANPDVADAGSAFSVLELAQPNTNHNGGHLEFAPDGMLLVGLGDGGGIGDPRGWGQDRSNLFGSILRLDVDREPYAIPPDNPFAGQAGIRGEIWAWGLRNPWRFAVDAATSRLYIADVGESRFEEVNVASLETGGRNYGWSVMEGTACFRSAGCSTAGLVSPVVQYDHDDGCSITGGRVYRGAAIPGLVGHYVYSDYCRGWIRSFLMADGSPTLQQEWDTPDVGRVTSFGVDAEGELYLTVVGSGGLGEVLRIEPR